MSKNMIVITHAEDNKVPRGMALLCMNDNGWVGTNNGWPYTGQPAMYPEAQARRLPMPGDF